MQRLLLPPAAALSALALALALPAAAQPTAPELGDFPGCTWRPVAGETGLFCPAGRWSRRLAPHPDFGPDTAARARAGDTHAMAVLGIALHRSSWDASIRAGRKLLIDAADRGDPLALRTLGELPRFWFSDLPEIPAQAELYRRAAEKGDLPAMKLLGDTLWRNPAEAIAWYQRAAEQKYAPAMLSLANILEMEGPTQDEAGAIRWYRSAADAGDIYAMQVLASRYERGLTGFPRDVEQGKAWRRRADAARAAELRTQIAREIDLVPRTGDQGPENELAELYLRGSEGVPRDLDQALALLRSATEHGDQRAAHRLQTIHEHGIAGVAADPAQARYWADRIDALTLDLAIAGAETGNAWDMERLATLYLTGDDPGSSLIAPVDTGKGLAWLKKALDANPGDAELAVLMARVQREGLGVPKDVARAEQWAARAAAESPLLYMPVDRLAVLAEKGPALTMFALANRTRDAADPNEAVFWFFLGYLRAGMELAVNDEPAQAYGTIIVGMGDEMKRRAAIDFSRFQATLDRVLAWDERHPLAGASAATRKEHRAGIVKLRDRVGKDGAAVKREWDVP